MADGRLARAPVPSSQSDKCLAPGCWKASDGTWYPPEAAAGRSNQAPRGWTRASDGNWYPDTSKPVPPPMTRTEKVLLSIGLVLIIGSPIAAVGATNQSGTMSPADEKFLTSVIHVVVVVVPVGIALLLFWLYLGIRRRGIWHRAQG